MKGLKRSFYRVIVLAVAVMLLFTACSSGGSSTVTDKNAGSAATDAQTSAVSQASSAKSGAPAELVLGYWIMTPVPSDMQLVLDEVNKILVPEINVKIVSTIGLNFGNYRDQLNLMLSSNEHLDAFACYAGDFGNYVAKGQVVEMDDLLAKYGKGIVDAVGMDYLKAGVINGKQYGLTTNRDLALDHGFVMIKEILDKYKIDYTKIKTLDDVAGVFQTIKEKEPNMIPLATQASAMMDQIPTVDRLGDYLGVLLNYGQNDLKVVNYFDTPEYEKYVRYFREWYKKGYMSENVLTNTDDPNALMRAGKAFSTTSNLKPGFDTKQSKVVQKPVVSVAVTPTYTATSVVQTAQWCIARNSKDPAATMKFLNKMYTDPKICNLLSWGIEGKHYVVKSNGLIDYPSGVTVDNVGYNLNLGWLFGNQFITYVWEGDPPDLYKQLDQWNKSAIKSKAFGFTYNSVPVKTEVAAVTNVCKQYRNGLEYGALDPDKILPEFRKKLKDAGIDKIVAEKQRQIDEWAKTQK